MNYIKKPKKRANDLNGREWMKFSISIWKDIKKNNEERFLNHPAIFPSMLVERIIRCFTTEDEKNILDPFMGSGSTLVAAKRMGKIGIGFEINPAYVEITKKRLMQEDLFYSRENDPKIYQMDARRLEDVILPNSIHLCITSPPYWDILSRKKNADHKGIRDYGSLSDDISIVKQYDKFLNELMKVFLSVYNVLIDDHYCIVNVMDLRKGAEFYPYHCDIVFRMAQIGFIFDDLIIWDRSQEYNNLRPLGYPYVFRINKVHEYLLIFRKPKKAGNL
ncbi:MAG: site-specific DNA-methyltransferase [Candidatus Hadarchaeum sp.]